MKALECECTERSSHFSLSDNKQSDLKARELKTVQMNETLVAMKLVLHHAHINDINLFNQVCSSMAASFLTAYRLV